MGGQIVAVAGWRAVFWTMVAIGLATLAALFTIPETHPAARRSRESLGRALLRYGELLRHRRLLGYVGTGGFLYAGLFAYVAGTPFAYIDYYHVPVRLYGLVFGLGIVGIMLASTLNHRLVPRYGYDRMLLIGTLIAASAAVMTALAARTGIGGLPGQVLSLCLFISTTGFVVANSITGALADFPERAGAVSALVGAFQYGFGIFGSGLVGTFADGTPWPMGWVISLAGIGSLLSMRLLAPKR